MPNRSQVVPIELPVIVGLRTRKVFAVLKPFLCEGALRHRNTWELYSNNLRAVGPNHAQLKTRQQSKTQGSKQGK